MNTNDPTVKKLWTGRGKRGAFANGFATRRDFEDQIGRAWGILMDPGRSFRALIEKKSDWSRMAIGTSCSEQKNIRFFSICLLIFKMIYDILKVRKRFRAKGVFPWFP